MDNIKKYFNLPKKYNSKSPLNIKEGLGQVGVKDDDVLLGNSEASRVKSLEAQLAFKSQELQKL